MKKYLRLYKQFLHISFRNQMTYRTNFFLAILVEFFWVCSHLLYILAIWRVGIVFPGLEKETALVFVGTYLCLTGGLMGILFNNLSIMPNNIHTGQMDLYLTKPVSAQFMTSLQHVDFGYPISDLSVGLILLIVGWHIAGLPLSFMTIFGFIFYFAMSLIWMYCFQMIPVLLSFIFVKTGGIFEVFYGLHDLNKVPMGIYGKGLRFFGTFILPVFPMANFPPMWAAGTLTTGQAIFGIAGPVVFFILIRICWKLVLRKYTSANG